MERNRKLKTNAQNLRKSLTKEEAKLWYQFLCRYPFRFRRQYVIGNYITDFYCHQARLVVELDGLQHYTQEGRLHDAARTEVLEKHGIYVLRFLNKDVDKNFEGVCYMIDKTIRERMRNES